MTETVVVDDEGGKGGDKGRAAGLAVVVAVLLLVEPTLPDGPASVLSSFGIPLPFLSSPDTPAMDVVVVVGGGGGAALELVAAVDMSKVVTWS